MHVVFLDIDGVLNSEAYALKLEERHRALGHEDPPRPKRETTCDCFKLYHQIDRDAVARVNRLVAATAAKIVISSTWRKLFDPPELERILVEHGLVAEIIGATPDGHDEPEMSEVFGPLVRIFRGHEIDFWLRKHPEVDRFVILDDGSDMEMHKNRLVQTDCEEGLLDEHVELAIRVMSWDGKSAPSPMDTMEPESESRKILIAEAEAAESSWGIHCNEDGCVEALSLARTTAVQPTDEEIYQNLGPALDTAAVFLGWRVWRFVWWCPMHTVSKFLACARCLSPCPECSCMGGPRSEAVDGMIIDVSEQKT